MIAQGDNLTGKDSAVNVTDDREACPKFWIAAYTKSRCEKKAAEALAKDIETFVPIQKVEKQWSDRRKKVDTIVIPMVIFAHVTKEDILKVKQDPRVTRVLSYPGRREAAIIPDDQIENLRLMLTKAETPVEFISQPIRLADTVRVKAGNLEGLVGRVERLGGNKAKIVVSIDLLGGAMVEIDSGELEIFFRELNKQKFYDSCITYSL